MPLAAVAPTEDALAAAREILPAWVVWGRAVLFPCAVFLAQLSVSGWLVALQAPRAGPQCGLHWSERARQIANTKIALGGLAMCVIAPAFLIPILLPTDLDPLPDGWIAVADLFGLILAANVGAWWIQRELVGREVGLREFVRQSLTHALLFQPATVLGVLCALLVGRHPSPPALALLVLGSVAILALCLGQGWRVLRAFGLAREIEVSTLTGQTAKGVRYLEVDLTMANAVALIVARVVILSRRAREILAPDELAAVLQHELGHLAESRAVIFMRLQGATLLLALAWSRPLYGWFGVAALAVLGLALLAAHLATRKSKSWEERADTHAHDHIEDSRSYARALEKLHQDNLAPAVTHKAKTHPHLYDRMLAAGVTPDFARPEPTKSSDGWGIVLFLVMLTLFFVVDHNTRPSSVDPEEPAVLRALALGGYTDAHLDTLADIREERGDLESAARFRAAVEELRSGDSQAETGSQR